MKKIHLKTFLTFIFILTLISTNAVAVLAGDTSPGFSVSTLPNKYQSKDNGYFDLDLLKTGGKTTLNLKIFNNSNNISFFDVSISDALTNANLVLDYSDERNSNQLLSGLKLTDYVSVKTPLISVKPHSSVTASFNVNMPSEEFDGQIVGGIYLRKHMNKKQTGTKHSFGYVNTIVLRDGDQSLQADPKITRAKYTSRNKVPTVEGTIKNPVQAYESIMYLKQYISDAGGKVIEARTVGGRAVAPNSQTDVYFKLNKPLSSGKYYYNFEFTTKEEDRVIKSSAPFEVVNTDNIAVNANKMTLTTFLFLLLLLIIIFLLLFLLYGRRRRRKETQRNK